jgi:hypothetical protein
MSKKIIMSAESLSATNIQIVGRKSRHFVVERKITLPSLYKLTPEVLNFQIIFRKMFYY